MIFVSMVYTVSGGIVQHFGLWSLLLGLLAVSAQAQTLTWYEIDLPPVYIVSGPNQGQGQLDLFTAFLRSKIPEYNHRRETVNLPRIFEQLRGPDLGVFAGAQRTRERQAVGLFSSPFLATPPPFLVVRREDAATLAAFTDNKGAVDLDGWLRAHSLGLVAGRSYTAPVDEFLAQRVDPAQVVRRYSPNELASGLVSMLSGKRVDSILSFDSELKIIPGVGTWTATAPIQGIPEFVPLYVVATRSPEGEVLIRKINAILEAYWNDPVMRSRAFYPDNEFIRRFLARGYQKASD